jgi:hypothetical protein
MVCVFGEIKRRVAAGGRLFASRHFYRLASATSRSPRIRRAQKVRKRLGEARAWSNNFRTSLGGHIAAGAKLTTEPRVPWSVPPAASAEAIELHDRFLGEGDETIEQKANDTQHRDAGEREIRLLA